MFSPNSRHSVQDGQEPTQQQHHGFLLLQGDQSSRQNPHLSDENHGRSGPYSPTITGSGRGPAHGMLLSNRDYSSSGSFEPYSQHSTQDSYNSSNTSYSLPSDLSSDRIDPNLTQLDITSEYQTYLTDMLPVASPDPTLSPALFPYQSISSTRVPGYGTNQPSGYFDTYPDHQQYPITPGIYHNPVIRGPMPSPHPPVSDHLSPGLYVCYECGKGCKRQTDLDRHLKTTKRHGDPKGPTCPESDCRYTARFSRTDNFKAHYKNQHGKSDKEADEFIQQWKAQSNLEFPVGVPGRVWDNDGGAKGAPMRKKRGSGSGGR